MVPCKAYNLIWAISCSYSKSEIELELKLAQFLTWRTDDCVYVRISCAAILSIVLRCRVAAVPVPGAGPGLRRCIVGAAGEIAPPRPSPVNG